MLSDFLRRTLNSFRFLLAQPVVDRRLRVGSELKRRDTSRHAGDRGDATAHIRVLVCLAIATMAFLAYARALQLPFISDDYDQIARARAYGPVSGWTALSQDALYRCRATSLIVTYWTERCFGTSAFVFNLSSLLIHVLDSLLVFAMGMWRPVGWRVSGVAACFFAISQRHHEAVIWYAALPELLVFCFVLMSFLSWVHWLQSDCSAESAYWCAFIFYIFALLSKESAVCVPPLLLFAGLIQRLRLRVLFTRLLPFTLCAVLYFALIFAARKTHLHFNDAGTFSLSAPFVQVMVRSLKGLVWFWGFVALVALLVWRVRGWSSLLWIGGVWSVVTLLPYCFLTYMPSVPSRHTYLASVGLALLVSIALIEFHDRTSPKYGRAAIGLLAGAIIVHQCAYLWIVKQSQFEVRAEPTERLIKAAQSTRPLHVTCFPYARSIAELAVRIRVSETALPVVFEPPGRHTDGLDLCFDDGQRSHSNLPN